MLGASLYAAALNGAFNLAESQPLAEADLAANNGEANRIIRRAEEWFQQRELSFDHFKPAMWLPQHSEVIDEEKEDVKRAL
ncbi:MAG: hypothetical protein ACOZCP_09825 [Pseudomonadota bacterium]